MKAKITKPDGTVVELEGTAMDLVILLPDLKGYAVTPVKEAAPVPFNPAPYVQTIPWTGPVQAPWVVPTGCTCGAWWGITPPPPCPVHSNGSYTWPPSGWTISTTGTSTAAPTTSVIAGGELNSTPKESQNGFRLTDFKYANPSVTAGNAAHGVVTLNGGLKFQKVD